MHLCEFDKPEEEVMGIKNVFFRIGTTLNSRRVPSMLDSLRKPTHYTKSYKKTKAKVDKLMLSKELLGKYPKCKNCVTNHKAESCIAKGKPCYECKKLGHFKQFCRSSGRDRGRFNGQNFNNQNYGNCGRGGYNNQNR